MTLAEARYRIIARQSAGIRRIQDLRGKKVAATVNTSSQYYLREMLRKAGMQLESEDRNRSKNKRAVYHYSGNHAKGKLGHLPSVSETGDEPLCAGLRCVAGDRHFRIAGASHPICVWSFHSAVRKLHIRGRGVLQGDAQSGRDAAECHGGIVP